jgi:hypothetical protein
LIDVTGCKRLLGCPPKYFIVGSLGFAAIVYEQNHR